MASEPTPVVMKYAVGGTLAAALLVLAWTFPLADPQHQAYRPGDGPVDAGQGSSLAAGGERLPRMIVKEVHDAGKYTVLALQSGDKVFWAAVPAMPVKVGDEIHLHGGAPQADFHSPTLNRTFASIWFADSAHVAGAAGAEAHEAHEQPAAERGLPGQAETVLSAEEAGRFTIMRLRRGETERWVAAPKFDVGPGQKVVVAREMVMKNFHSGSLNRTFEEIVFAEEAKVVGDGAVPAPVAAPAPAPAPAVAGAGESIDPPPGGLRIAQLYAERAQHKDRQATLRGRVVKYSPLVMGKNWLHLQDGSAPGPEGNLVVATGDTARVGDVITVTGKVVLDKELSPMHRYEVLLDEATVVGP